MEKFINNISKIEHTLNNDYLIISLGFIFCLICSFILKYVYEQKSTALVSKIQIGKIIPILSLSVFLIFLVVKSSLALSLGLVGALSIVRFRTPIKEPEELVYLFLSIAIGLGYGAGQIVLTSFVFPLILIIVWLFSIKKINFDNKQYNLIVSWKSESDKTKILEDVTNSVSKYSSDSNLLKYDLEEGANETIGFLVNIKL